MGLACNLALLAVFAQDAGDDGSKNTDIDVARWSFSYFASALFLS